MGMDDDCDQPSVYVCFSVRHPVQEMSCSPFVSNDTFSASRAGVGKMKLLTGTNASGKSVYLKQVSTAIIPLHGNI